MHRMDITRKFIQMGRTRSLRYALRPGGRKYDKETGQEIERTGEVADQGKLKGAQIFEDHLKVIERDEVYVAAKNAWRVEVEGRKPLSSTRKAEVATKPEPGTALTARSKDGGEVKREIKQEL
jgi:hypothetical protein